MRIALVGPTHPYKGGIPQHTTALAHHLEDAGHEVDLISWSAQYPSFLYPGVQRVAKDEPEIKPFARSSFPLSWKNPLSWQQVGRRLRTYDQIIIVMASPAQAPFYLAILKVLGKGYRNRVLALSHNVLPHEPRVIDIPLIKVVFKNAGHILVHTPEQAALANKLSETPVIVATMPPHLPGLEHHTPHKKLKAARHHLLFFGLVRNYKGVDILIQALSQVPHVTLTIAGEVWGDKHKYTDLIKKLHLEERVKFEAGYVPAKKIAALFAEADALVLPYRSGTATQNVTLANAHGLPAIATKVGSIASQIQHDIDGLLCQPDSADSLAEAIKRLYEPGILAKLQSNIQPFSDQAEWEEYVQAITEARGV